MILPGATIGLLGGGQLGRMFTARARGMGYAVTVLDPDPDSPAGGIATQHLCAPYTDPTALDSLAARCAVVTTEFENVPAGALTQLNRSVQVRPGARALSVAQDRAHEKRFLESHGIATAPFAIVESAGDLASAWAAIGAPALLKTSRLGYDGKGQCPISTFAELEQGFSRLGEVPCVLEQRLTLDAELSVVLARGDDGHVEAFPPGQNIHRNGILETTTVPSRLPTALAQEAVETAATIAQLLDYVGVLGVEFFIDPAQRVYTNEIAPRPHNSGHFTQDACSVSQFEQQIRAICGLPLARPILHTPVCMINLLGELWQHDHAPPWDRVLALEGVHLHLYGKAAARPGRKMGHLNCLADSSEEAFTLAHTAWGILRGTSASRIPTPRTS